MLTVFSRDKGYRKPVLYGDDAEHGGAGEMPRDDVAGEPSWQRVRGLPTSVEHGVVVFLRTFRVFVPPLPERRHVVAGDGAYGAVWVA